MALSIRPLTEALGVEVAGIDLAQPVSEQDRDALETALDNRLVMVIRDQELTSEQYLGALRLFGETMEQHLTEILMDDHPEIAVLDSRKHRPGPDGRVAALGSRDWHTDHTNHARPPKVTALYAKALPRSGGDTEFANMQRAYDGLPAAEQRDLAALHTVNKIEDHDYVSTADKKRYGVHQTHPLVRTHPVTGKKALYFHPGKTERISGMEHQESLDFLNGLLDRIISPDITYRHRWRLGDIVLCDNRAVLHIAHDDYDHSEGRVMHRVLLRGDVPA